MKVIEYLEQNGSQEAGYKITQLFLDPIKIVHVDQVESAPYVWDGLETQYKLILQADAWKHRLYFVRGVGRRVYY